MLNASSNEIQSISCAFPPHLLELDLSNNQLSSLDFLENEEKVPVDLEQLNVSGNKIRDLIELRFISLFPKLRFLNIGLLKQEQSNQILEFVKHLCPSLEFFDDADCFDFDGNDFKEDELLPILIGGSEQRLQKYLFSSDIIVSWDKPYFIPFNDANISDSAEKVKKLENQINTIERRAQDTDSYEQLRDEIATLREQMSKLAELLFVHDQALREIWNK
ncbi:Leucine Rich Repeat family protein [Histomonas meleagridis]|uniref:Leucine Rich Repeat family protein n=1 Tax=Histomonas meleagridis TaxID=135588 RepID=UPI00355ACCA3|nr:Leucine Rich Repeat family protein [Histomonas meleagridis]KAH0800134.1 Leucine Rich Repeat family protein [Histomonas meleagridis]